MTKDFSKYHLSEYYEYITKGFFTPEQFGFFLNMPLDNIEDSILVQFHECFHYWQSIFTPYGYLKWGHYRTVSSNVIQKWLEATKWSPSKRVIPVANLLPCKNIEQFRKVFEIYLQELGSRIFNFTERCHLDNSMKSALHITEEDICPTIELHGELYKLNGIDILESFAKFQEAVYANMIDGTHLHETIDIKRLKKEYYSAYYYFLLKVGANRTIEFPVACELALMVDMFCGFSDINLWKTCHPAWRFVKIVDTIFDSTIKALDYKNVESDFSYNVFF